MFSALPILRSFSRYAVSGFYIAASAGVVAAGLMCVSDTRRSVMSMGMCVILAFMLFFFGVISPGRESDGMELGDFDDDEPVVDLNKSFPEMHLHRRLAGRRPRTRIR